MAWIETGPVPVIFKLTLSPFPVVISRRRVTLFPDITWLCNCEPSTITAPVAEQSESEASTSYFVHLGKCFLVCMVKSFVSISQAISSPLSFVRLESSRIYTLPEVSPASNRLLVLSTATAVISTP
uniref:Uncharacterized protein n=1 Tax=uncultured marine virus TaxID=186617 RepID=A0A0F7L3M9_9VIRU|nr:hypothetical protein [uncultured marine virus]